MCFGKRVESPLIIFGGGIYMCVYAYYAGPVLLGVTDSEDTAHNFGSSSPTKRFRLNKSAAP